MLGSHCAEYFAQAKNKVIVYDNLQRSRIFYSAKKSVEYNWDYLGKFKNITRIKGDVKDKVVLNRVFRKYKPDVVIHAAAQPGVRFSLDNPSEDFEINCLGTVNVLEVFRKYNKKAVFIYCSTNKVYGDKVNSLPRIELKTRYAFKDISGIGENTAIEFSGHTPYSISKLAGDLYVQNYAHIYGIKTAVFRLSCIYGTRQFGFEDQGWVAWFCIRLLLGDSITIYGNGKQLRDVLWVEDLVKAFDKFIKSRLKYGVFNIGGGPKNTLSLLELAGLLERITARKTRIDFKVWRKFDQKVYISSIDKIKTILDWKPLISPEEGVQKLVKWIKNNPGFFVR